MEREKREADHNNDKCISAKKTISQWENIDTKTTPKHKQKDTKKKLKTCRFLTSACNITHTNSFVVMGTKIDNGNGAHSPLSNQVAHEGNDKLNQSNNNVDEFGRAAKRTKPNPFTSSNDLKSDTINSDATCLPSTDTTAQKGTQKLQKYKKIKKQTQVLTTSKLPQPSLETQLISPQDALSQVHFKQKLYREVKIYVKPLIVLDINGILCHRIRENDIPPPLKPLLALSAGHKEMEGKDIGSGRRQINQEILYRPPIGHIARTNVVARTDLRPFLGFLIDHFTLALWSSARKRTVKALTDMLIPENIKRKLLFVWGQEKCERINESNKVDSKNTKKDDMAVTTMKSPTEQPLMDALPDGPGRKSAYRGILFIKHLSKVWAEFPMWNHTNTLLMDDSPDKVQKYKMNAIHPPPILGLNMEAIVAQKDNLIISEKEEKNDQEEMGDGMNFNIDTNLYCDQANQAKQMLFFQNLAKEWGNRYSDEEFLIQFLRQNKSHMHWAYS